MGRPTNETGIKTAICPRLRVSKIHLSEFRGFENPPVQNEGF
jgi:hypothetical protein